MISKQTELYATKIVVPESSTFEIAERLYTAALDQAKTAIGAAREASGERIVIEIKVLAGEAPVAGMRGG